MGQLKSLGSAWSYLHAFIPMPVISLKKNNFGRISESYPISKKVQHKKKIPQMDSVAEPATLDTILQMPRPCKTFSFRYTLEVRAGSGVDFPEYTHHQALTRCKGWG